MIGGAFLGGGVEVVPAGYCKLELEILTEDRKNLAATFTIKGTSTYTVTAGADGRAVYTVPSGQTYTVSVNTTGYDNIASQTVVAESGTVRYVRFEAFEGRVKRSGDTMTGGLVINTTYPRLDLVRNDYVHGTAPTSEKIWALTRVLDNGTTKRTLMTNELKVNTSETFSYSTSVYDSNNKWHYPFVIKWAKDYSTVEVTAPTPSDTADNYDKIATTKWVNSASSVVHTTGNETISGAKTFTSNPVIKNANPFIRIVQTSDDTKDTTGGITIGNNPDKVDSGRASFTMYHSASSGATLARMRALSDDGTVKATLDVRVDADKSAYATAPTTPSTATSNEIATADWSIGKFVPLDGSKALTGTLQAPYFRAIGRYVSVPTSGEPGMDTRHHTTDVTTFPEKYDYFFSIVAKDVNGKSLGFVRFDGYQSARRLVLNAGATVNGEYISGEGGLVVNSGGEKYFYMPYRAFSSRANTDVLCHGSIPTDARIVHTTGNETVSGTKTFTSNPYVTRSGNAVLYLKRDVADSDTTLTHGTLSIQSGTEEKASVRGVANTGYSTAYFDAVRGGNRVSISVVNSMSGNYATAPTTPTNATSNEIATADWVLSKVQGRSRLHEFNTFAELKSLIASGKRGDSFSLTIDYVGDSIIEGYEAENAKIHTFGNYSINTLVLKSGVTSSLEAFGSGEVRYNSKTFASTGYGMMSVLDKDVWAIRVPYGSYLNYFYITENEITSCTGYYIEL